MKIIRSKDNPTYKEAAKLLRKKYRDQTGMFLLEGPRPVMDALKAGNAIHTVFLRENAADSSLAQEAEAICARSDVRIAVLADELFDRLSETEHSQGVLATACKSIPQELRGPAVVLDRLQDPGNIGTIIRTAEAAGFGTLITIKGTGDIYSPKTVRAAAGSLLRVDVFEGYETALLIVGGIFFSAVVCGLILKFKVPSLYAKLASRKDGYTRKTKKSDKTEKIALEEKKEAFQSAYPSKNYKEEEYSKTVYIEAVRPKQILFGQDKNRINIDLNKLPLTVGRQEKTADFVINNNSISKLHARFFAAQDRVYVEDLNSTNGIIKNGIRLTPGEPVLLNLEDRITIGTLDFVYA